MADLIKPLPELNKYVKRLNSYLQEHYPANKKISAEEWNALFLALIRQGNLQEETLEKICNEYLPLQIEKVNTLVNLTNDHENRIAKLRTDTDMALFDSGYAVATANTALNRVTEKAGTVAYVKGVLTPTLEYDADPQAQLDKHTLNINDLQSQIDLMEQNTNVADVVGTFADLSNYDKSKITANDIVEVLQDETRDNADTYYRLVENTWVYVGKLGSYYTRGESDALLAKKVNYADYKDTLNFAEAERQKSKNLFNATISRTVSNNLTYHADTSKLYLNGTTTYGITKFGSSSLKKGTYTMCVQVASGTFESTMRFSLYVGNTTTRPADFLANLFVGNNKAYATFTLTEDYPDLYFGFYVGEDDKVINNLVVNYQIVEGSVADYAFQPYNGAITHNGDKPVTFAETERQKSKNLFNKYTDLDRIFGWSSGETILQSDGTIKATANYNNGVGKGAVVYLKPNTQYCLSFKQVGFEDPARNGNIRISAVNKAETSYTELTSTRVWSGVTSYSIPFITTDSGIIHVSFCGSQNSSDVNSFKYILYDAVQIEEGAVATDYQPYRGGPISHNGDAPVVFAETERQKSKNLLKYPYYASTRSDNGVTLTDNGDGTITVNGSIQSESGGNAIVQLTDPNNTGVLLKAGNYRLYNIASKEHPHLYVTLWDKTNNIYYPTYTNRFSNIILDKDITGYFYVELSKYATVSADNIVVKPMLLEGINPGQDSDNETWQPYNGAIVHEKSVEGVEQLQTIYDKASNNSTINKGYTSGIQFGVDVSFPGMQIKYKGWYFTFHIYGAQIRIYTPNIDVGKDSTINRIVFAAANQGIGACISYGSINIVYNSITSSGCRNYHVETHTNTSVKENANYYISKIEGVLV